MDAHPVMSRRDVLRLTAASAAALGLSGCADRSQGPSRGSGEGVGFDAAAPGVGALAVEGDDIALVERTMVDETRLMALYRTVGQGQPALAPRVNPLITAQKKHLAVLQAAHPATGSSVTPPVRPVDQAAAIKAIVQQAAAASGRRMEGCLAADSGPLARALASMAASHAVTAASWKPVS